MVSPEQVFCPERVKHVRSKGKSKHLLERGPALDRCIDGTDICKTQKDAERQTSLSYGGGAGTP